MFAFSPLTIFDDIIPTRERVLVISDAQYAEYKRSEALKQIDALRARADDYAKALAITNLTIAGIRKEHNIPEPESETSDQKS